MTLRFAMPKVQNATIANNHAAFRKRACSGGIAATSTATVPLSASPNHERVRFPPLRRRRRNQVRFLRLTSDDSRQGFADRRGARSKTGVGRLEIARASVSTHSSDIVDSSSTLRWQRRLASRMSAPFRYRRNTKFSKSGYNHHRQDRRSGWTVVI